MVRSTAGGYMEQDLRLGSVPELIAGWWLGQPTPVPMPPTGRMTSDRLWSFGYLRVLS